MAIKKDKLIIEVRSPLTWPTDWPRTLLKERATRVAWKRNEREAIEDLAKELQSFDVLTAVLTRQDPNDRASAPDFGVSLFYSRKRAEDFSWQTALEIDSPAPTKEEIEKAFRRLSAKHHSDAIEHGSGGSVDVWHKYQRHKENALSYVARLGGKKLDQNIACDQYTEVKWNIQSLANTIWSLRQMERDGATPVFKRVMQATAALTSGMEGDRVNVAASS